MSVSNTNTGITITQNGVTIPDVAEIRNVRLSQFREVWGQDLDGAPYTPQGQMIDTETAIIDDKNAQLQYILNQMDPEKNEGIWQEGIGKIYFITRKPAAPTIVTCQVVGIVGTVIPAGALVQDDSNIIYESTAAFLITKPSPMNLVFRSQTPGPIACPAGSVNRIFTQVPGWDLVSNEQAGIPGNYEETRSAFENRRYLSVAKNAHGNQSAVWGAIADLDGVLSVQIAENTKDIDQMIRGVLVHGHSFFISIVGGSPQDIAQTIYQRKDGGCGYDGNTEVTILIPTRNSITLQKKIVVYNIPENIPGAVKVNIATREDTPGNIEELVQQAIINNWNGISGNAQEQILRVEIGETLLASRFYCSVREVGVNLFDLLRIRVGRASTNGGAVTWGEAVGFTLDEYPTIDKRDIKIVYGSDPEDTTPEGQFWQYSPEEGGGVVLNPTVSEPITVEENFSLDEGNNGIITNPESLQI